MHIEQQINNNNNKNTWQLHVIHNCQINCMYEIYPSFKKNARSTKSFTKR